MYSMKFSTIYVSTNWISESQIYSDFALEFERCITEKHLRIIVWIAQLKLAWY